MREKAWSWLPRAADLARARCALDEQIGLLWKAGAREPDPVETVRLWEEIAHAHALTYDDDGFRDAVLRAIALCTDDEKRAALFGEGAFQNAIRWQKEADRELIEDWSRQALDLSGSATR